MFIRATQRRPAGERATRQRGKQQGRASAQTRSRSTNSTGKLMQGALVTQCPLPWGTLREKELTKGARPLYPLSAVHQEEFDQEEFRNVLNNIFYVLFII